MLKNRLILRIGIILLAAQILGSCITYRYIGDEESLQRQKEIRGKRVGNVIGASFLTLASVVVAAFTGVYVSYIPEDQNLKQIRLVNPGPDTLQVNMFTDQVWKDSMYCDFRNLLIPPGQKCRLLVPSYTAYNLYFSNTPGSEEDDELIEFNTSSKSKIILVPGMTLDHQNDSTLIIEEQQP
jgi:hypothetical protein